MIQAGSRVVGNGLSPNRGLCYGRAGAATAPPVVDRTFVEHEWIWDPATVMTMPAETTRLKSARRGRVDPFIVMEVLAAANRPRADGRPVLHLEVGEPGSGAPKAVLDAAKRALDVPGLGYTEACGLPELRARIAGHVHAWYGVPLDPGRVVVSVGASGAFVLAFLAAFDAGDRVVVGDPGYPAYRNILRALDIEVVSLPTGPSTRFQPSVAALDALPGPIHGLILASPSNPTGTMLEREELRAIAGHCRARGIRLVVDEIYHGITYGRSATSILEIDDSALVINSFSKYFCMTGWRLGWLVVPKDLVSAVERLAQNLFISPPTLSQRAALAAFDAHDELQANVALYGRNRERVLNELVAAGLDRIAPVDGAFYAYVDVSALTDDSVTFARDILDEAGVALTPGVDFDPGRGQGYLRLSFAGGEDEVARAAIRLRDWVRARR